jgi:hypothetical protein
MHLSENQLAAFRKRSVPAADLIAIDSHLAACEECRARLEPARLVLPPAVTHLTFEDVQALAEGKSRPSAASHARSCASCLAEVADLKAFLPQAAPRRSSFKYWAVAAALLAIVSPLTWKLSRKEPMPAEESALVQTALRDQRLPIPESIAALHLNSELLLGASPTQASFRVLQPLGGATITARPQFSWDAFDGATEYRVAIFDRDFKKIAESAVLTGLNWTPDRDFPTGATYSWSVTARRGDTEIRSPLPPAPEAQFIVPTAAELAHIDDLRQHYPKAHLLLACVYARAGALSDARRELALQPDSPAIRGLLASIPK